MDLYTLTDQFLTNEPLDEFVSAIWTERYSVAGDVQLVVPASQTNIDKLAPGTFLALRGTKEVMVLETQSIEQGLMTVTGKTLVTFLDQRVVWFKNPDYDTTESPDKIVDYVDSTKKPGAFISDVVNKMVIDTVPFTGTTFSPVNLNWDYEEIPHLVLGPVDSSGVVKRLTMPIGPLYTGVAQLAEQEGVGISLYLESANPVTGYVLKFTTYRGLDHTSTQSVNPLVRLVPELDSIQNLKEIHSNAIFKNVVYVYYKGEVSKHLLDPTQPEPEGMARRVLVRNAEGEPVGRTVYNWMGQGYSNVVVGPTEIAAFRDQNAKDAFANYNYIRAIDGETSPQNDYKFGVDYGLGDIIELEGLTGVLSKALITEYIRSQDKAGEREYPTITVVGGGDA